MRLEWIDDILAVLDSGSLARAAERRFLTQSAFTRRVRMIEDSIGVTLFDRRRKPVELMPGVQALEPELRELSARLRRLRHELQMSEGQAGRAPAFVCQHAITATVSPWIVRVLNAGGEASIRVHSANQDECLMQLLSNDVDFAVMYEITGDRSPVVPKAFESVTLGTDMLIPVCAPSVVALANGPEIPIISYPSDVFMGRVYDRTISPRLPTGASTATKAETALTLAMLQFALSEIGIAWLPKSLVLDHLAQEHLVAVDDRLPAQALDIKMVRLSEGQAERGRTIWQNVVEHLDLPAALHSTPGTLAKLAPSPV